MQRTILELDLVGYSDIATESEEQLDAESVAKFNRQIQGFINRGLEAAGLNREETNLKSTGDGAIVVLDTPEHAHRTADAVYRFC